MRDVKKLRSSALGVLREGRCTVVYARSAPDVLVPHEVVARVQGHKGRYAVDFIDGAWSCTCQQDPPCPHVAAVQLITGFAPAATA